MDELEKMLKDMVLGVVGAVATVVEKGAEVGQALVRKGEQTVEDNRENAEEFKRKVKETIDSVATKMPDVRQMTPDQRAELRRELDAADAEEANVAEEALQAAREAADCLKATVREVADAVKQTAKELEQDFKKFANDESVGNEEIKPEADDEIESENKEEQE